MYSISCNPSVLEGKNSLTMGKLKVYDILEAMLEIWNQGQQFY
jgi:hypothetical protein